LKKIIIICALLALAGCDKPSMKPFSFSGLNFTQTKEDLLKNGFVCNDETKTTDIDCVKNIERKQVTVNLFPNSVIRSIIVAGTYTGGKESCDNALFSIENMLDEEFNAGIKYEKTTGDNAVRINNKTVLINGKSYQSNDGRGQIEEKLDYVNPEKSNSRIISYFGQCIVTDNNEYNLSLKFENKTSGGEELLKTMNTKTAH
jgi:hypothetical protein